MMDAALSYAARGWRVFPCQPRGKSPKTAHGHNDATTDEAQIRAWWGAWPDANIGLATGDGLAVIDVDEEAGFDELETAHGDMATTLESVTGSGGRHLFYSYSGGELRSRNGFGRGVDLKSDGGYVIVAPSVHPSGGVYTWDTPDEGPSDPIAALPSWVRQVRQAVPTARGSGGRGPVRRTSSTRWRRRRSGRASAVARARARSRPCFTWRARPGTS